MSAPSWSASCNVGDIVHPHNRARVNAVLAKVWRNWGGRERALLRKQRGPIRCPMALFTLLGAASMPPSRPWTTTIAFGVEMPFE